MESQQGSLYKNSLQLLSPNQLRLQYCFIYVIVLRWSQLGLFQAFKQLPTSFRSKAFALINRLLLLLYQFAGGISFRHFAVYIFSSFFCTCIILLFDLSLVLTWPEPTHLSLDTNILYCCSFYRLERSYNMVVSVGK